MVTADRADADEQLRAAIVAPSNRADRELCGFIPRTQHFGPTAAALHHNRFPRNAAFLARFFLYLPRFGFFGDFSVIAQLKIASEVLLAFTGLNEIRRRPKTKNPAEVLLAFILHLRLKTKNPAQAQVSSIWGLSSIVSELTISAPKGAEALRDCSRGAPCRGCVDAYHAKASQETTPRRRSLNSEVRTRRAKTLFASI